jgi:hypothetical protein
VRFLVESATIALVVGIGLLVNVPLARWRWGRGSDVAAWSERFAAIGRLLVGLGLVLVLAALIVALVG